MADPMKRIAQFVRMLGSGGERRNAWVLLERCMRTHGISWTDIGNAIERHTADGKYSEDEMKELAQAVREEGIEAGIKIGLARAETQQQSDGRLTLPEPAEMARYCHDRLGRLKDTKQRDFVTEMYIVTRRARGLSLGRLGYLASIYIQHGGRI